MIKRVFLICFVASTLIQSYWWHEFDVIDGEIWSNQAHYVETGDSRQFDPKLAYNPPGGPIIIGMLAIHRATGIEYHEALLWFMSLFNGLIIAGICTICFVIRPKNYWYAIILWTLSFNRLYESSTPPSACVSLLIVLLSMLTIYLYENRDRATSKVLIVWALAAGLAIATRVEVSVLAVIFLLSMLKPAIGLKKTLKVAIGSAASFVAFDPFMWKIPFQHISDIVQKVVEFHDKGGLDYIHIPTVLSISCLAIMSMILAISFAIFSNKGKLMLSKRIVLTLFGFSLSMYAILLSSHYQPARYFLPIVMIWETLLPIYLMALFSKLDLGYINGKDLSNEDCVCWPIQLFVGCIFVGFQLAIYYVLV